MIRNTFLFCFLFLAILMSGMAQSPEANYEEANMPPYLLPDVLLMNNGKKVTTVKEWEGTRRKEILAFFEGQVYGKVPDKKVSVRFEVKSVDAKAINGKATRKEVTVHFGTPPNVHSMDILIYLPNARTAPAPLFLGMNFYGNHTIWNDPGISLAKGWVGNNKEFHITENKATEASRGVRSSRWPVEMIIDRGYAVATVYYGDLDPDFDDGFKNGVHPLFYKKGQDKPGPGEWGAIGAWAWGMSRALDYFETDKDINARRVALLGHSRIGKAALWAGATDKRFALVISNESGCGGAALSKRIFGETVGRINTSFPHWFCDNFNQYSNKESELPMDQHMLLALIAPRPLYVASAAEDLWADPKGEYLGAYHASPAYRLYGLQGMDVSEMPGIHQPIKSIIGYHVRAGKHDVTTYDWEQFIDFANRHMK